MRPPDTESTGFSDHFSGHAGEYAAARPVYPAELFEFLAGVAPSNTLAWDCATGSGQAALGVAEHFDFVIATDASEQQISHATQRENVEYRRSPAEASGLDAGSVDLVTVAQALHWFDFARFNEEVQRVATHRAVIAVWSYGLTSVTPAIDALIDDFYTGEINPHWPPEREHIENHYRDIPFPFEAIETPDFAMSATWKAEDMLAYLRTWSSVKYFQKEHRRDPVTSLDAPLATAWGDRAREVRWPMTLKVGQVR